MKGCVTNLGVAILCIIAIAIVYSWLNPRSNEDGSESIQNRNALEAILEEDKVLDATITDSQVLYAQIRDDGTNRDGYAEYLCQLLDEYHSSATRVKLVRVNSSTDPDRDNAFGVLLGESWCK